MIISKTIVNFHAQWVHMISLQVYYNSGGLETTTFCRLLYVPRYKFSLYFAGEPETEFENLANNCIKDIYNERNNDCEFMYSQIRSK